MIENKVEAIEAFCDVELEDNEIAFIFLGYSSILLKSEKSTIAIDPGKSLTQSKASAIKHLDLLLFTHNHWDHFKKDYALELIKQTRPHTVADIVSFEELKTNVPATMLTKADPASKYATHQIGDTEVTALQGIHVGPITQYLINLGEIRIFHGGDSGYWRQKDASADLAFVPVGTATTCSPATALATIMDLQPQTAIPIHGRRKQMKQFQNIVEKVHPEIDVIIPEKFELYRLLVAS